MFSSEFFRIGSQSNIQTKQNYTNFFEACLEEYIEDDISSKTLSRLTPRQVAVAIGVELSLLSSPESSPFEKRVYELLTNLTVGDGSFSLNLVNMLYDFLCICGDYSKKEFAKATFDSMYNTRVDKEDFDVKQHLTGKEAHLAVDGANLSQLIKTWIFMMSEMFHRFFYTYDPRATDATKAYYTVLFDATKRKRTCDDFLDFLDCIRPIYAQMCMISADKSEIHAIFGKAAAESKAIADKRREMRGSMRTKTSGKKFVKDSHAKGACAAAAGPVVPKVQITLAERMKNLESNLKKIQDGSDKPVIQVSAPPPSVWKKPAATSVAAAAPAESDSDSEEVEQSVTVTAKAESDGEGEFVVVKSRKTKTPTVIVEVKKNSTGRSHRIFSAMNRP